MKSLAGIIFGYNTESMDYTTIASIKSLQECCDGVIVVDAGSTDSTIEVIKSIADNKTTVLLLDEWNRFHGKEKLSIFTNMAAQKAKDMGFDYLLSLQMDECIHEDSYDWIRRAIETGAEGFVCKRINLWESPYKQLNVPQYRKPCSTEIVRLAKSCYRAYDDAESLAAPCINGFVNKIRIFHTGFVRRREIMKAKIINMQCGVFGMSNYDAKLDQCDVFNPRLWFGPEDLEDIKEPLPALIQKWAAERVYPEIT